MSEGSRIYVVTGADSGLGGRAGPKIKGTGHRDYLWNHRRGRCARRLIDH